MAELGRHNGTKVKVEEDLLRHMVLNCIRSYRQKYKNEYGEMIIACDDYKYWRKEVFPYYKANRKKNRDESPIDWNSFFESFSKIKAEIKEVFPYRVIQVSGAEADDIIGTICHNFGNTSEKILILSGDKDFVQLHSYFNVAQYDPVRKRNLVTNDPSRFVKEHIIRGDDGDGVPNFLSPDNCLVIGQRQKPIMQKKLDNWVYLDPKDFCNEEMLRNYYRNQQLVDLTFIPEGIKTNIMEEYEKQAGKDKTKLFNYFIQFKLKNLMDSIQEF